LLPRVLQQFMTTLARPAATTPHDTSVDLRKVAHRVSDDEVGQCARTARRPAR
jgi:hypothetical protein